jgi:flagellar protein FlaJ
MKPPKTSAGQPGLAEGVSVGRQQSRIWLTSYNLFGRRVESLLPHFGKIRKDLHRADIKVSLQAYVSFIFFITVLAPLIAFPTSFVVYYVFTGNLVSALFIGGVIALWAAAVAFLVAYIYPAYVASSKSGKIDNYLPYATSYMSILASAGTPPDRIFKSLASTDLIPVVSDYARNIVRDVSVLGNDLLTAVRKNAESAPSSMMKSVWGGMVATINSGGDIRSFLVEESKELMRYKRTTIRRFLDSLGLLAESYISLLVAFPLILVVMLAIMSSMGGTIGGISVVWIMILVTYVLIPVCASVIVLLIDAMSPK